MQQQTGAKARHLQRAAAPAHPHPGANRGTGAEEFRGAGGGPNNLVCTRKQTAALDECEVHAPMG